MDLNLEGTINDDTLIGGDGNDSIFGQDGNDSIFGGGGNDIIDGANGNDSIDGGEGNDTLIGFFGDDSINGGSGDDILIGFSGSNTLIGGEGNDVFVFDPEDMSGIDTVEDFVVGEDTFEIRAIVPPGGGIPEGGIPGGIPEGGIPEGGIPEGGIPEGGIPEGGIPGGIPGGLPEGEIIPGEYDPHTGILSANGNPIAQLPLGLDLNLQAEPSTAPVAQDDSLTTDEDTSISFDTSHLLNNDSDPDGDQLSITSVDDSDTKGIVLLDRESHTLTYDPNGQYEALNDGEDATDSFSYTIDDGNGNTAMGAVTINVTGISDRGHYPDGDDVRDDGNGEDTLNGNKGGEDNILYEFEGHDFLEADSGKDVFEDNRDKYALPNEENYDISHEFDSDRNVFAADAFSDTNTIEEFDFNDDTIGMSDDTTFDQITISQSSSAASDYSGQSIASISDELATV